MGVCGLGTRLGYSRLGNRNSTSMDSVHMAAKMVIEQMKALQTALKQLAKRQQTHQMAEERLLVCFYSHPMLGKL